MSDGLWTYERLRTCPRCAELNGPYSIYCIECGTRLVPSESELRSAKQSEPERDRDGMRDILGR